MVVHKADDAPFRFNLKLNVDQRTFSPQLNATVTPGHYNDTNALIEDAA